MTTTNHQSGLPEQEPTSPTAVVLCGDESWVNADVGWESRTQWWGAWGALRDFAAENGGATLFDIAYLPTGLTGVQKEAIRSAWSALTVRGSNVSAGVLRDAFPEVFADDLVSATWESGDSYETWADLLRVACMDGASVVGTQSGVTYSGLVFAALHDRVRVGTPGISIPLWGVGWTVTVTAPKPADPEWLHDKAVWASCNSSPRVWWRHDDGWSVDPEGKRPRAAAGDLYDARRLKPETIADLMGGEQA